MANLTRYLQKIFANNSNEVGVFGTGVDKETSKNVETLQSADYENGWSAAIVTNKNYPVWQEMDGVMYGMSYQLAYLLQKGIPEWLATETYYTNDFCRLGNVIYYSLQDSNIGNNPASEPTYWVEFGGANTDLSNLTSTGKTKVVTLANQLDWANAISITTTSGDTNYTCPADGIIFLNAYVGGNSTSKTINASFISKVPTGNVDDLYGVSMQSVTSAYLVASEYLAFFSGESAKIRLTASGGSAYNTVKATFVPFKKS